MTLIEQSSHGVTYMTSPNIHTTHAFTTRLGGVSRGVYASLNLGVNVGDDLSDVKDNYDRICRALNITSDTLISMRQVHGAHVQVVTHENCDNIFSYGSCEADGLITKEPNVALVAFAADCVPILLHNPVRNIIGAIHSGWRGTANDIVGIAVRKMSDEFDCAPADTRAVIGPSISKCCYDTDSDVADALINRLADAAENCITAHETKFMIDLKEANHLLLRRAGVCDIVVSDECTSCRSDKYWSHRRTSGRRGSQAAIIIIRK